MIEEHILKKLIKDKDNAALNDLLEEYNIKSLTESVEPLSIQEIIYILMIAPKHITGDLFAAFDEELKDKILSEIKSEDVNTLVEHLYTDDIVEALKDIPNQVARKVLDNVSKQSREDIVTLLNYELNTAGSLMTIEFIELLSTDTFKVAIDKVKGQGKVAEVVTDCYIIDKERHLKGALKLKDLIFGLEDGIVKDVMDTNVISVNVNTDQEEVLSVMQKYDLYVVPVVSDDEKLLGIITVDDVLDVMEQEVTNDVHSMAGIRELEESYLNTSVLEMTKARLPWLIFISATAVLTELVLRLFAPQMTVLPVLAAFIPMMMGTAGNAANQATVMVIRAIATKEITIKDSLKVVQKEVRVSFYLSIIMGLVAALRLIILPPSLGLDIVLSIALATAVSILIANIVGALLPFLVLKLNGDPTAMAAPVVTNIMDIMSLFIYFIFAILILVFKSISV